MADAREAILARLHAAAPSRGRVEPPAASAPSVSGGDRLERLMGAMRAAHTEFLDARGRDWVTAVRGWLAAEGIGDLLYAPEAPGSRRLAAEWPGGEVALRPWRAPAGEAKRALFTSGAGLTATRGGIARTGSLILWTDADQPRLLSLVPPVHLALLDPAALYDSLEEAMAEQAWAAAMPTNLLLVSGPSKTADIEQTLAYGVHGPKRLLVVLAEKAAWGGGG